MSRSIARRDFLRESIAIGTALTFGRATIAAADGGARNPICLFIKFVQSLSYDELADAVAEMKADGIEATVRKGGYIPPERATDELPELVETLAKRNLKVTMITTDVLGVDDPNTRPMLETAAKLGIPMYRMGSYKYDLNRSVMDQLNAIGPSLKELGRLNAELGIQAVYQNHSGADHVGGTVWDIYSLIKDIPKEQIALAFDIRHATIEAGLSWPTVYNAMRPRIATVYVKDFDWIGRRAEHVPLGKGRVDRTFFQQLVADGFSGPISLHVEYLEDGDAQENLAALRRDLGVLRGWLQS
ncbi:MAG TPA: sugar phosphate isomerase/epimerase family protein [Lacipirellulaceae bacterium]